MILSGSSFNSCASSCFAGVGSGAGDPYEKEWRKVDSLAGIGLPKSALELVEQIYERASAEANMPQLIKSVLYRVKLVSDVEEDFIVRCISDLKTEIAKAPTPARQILQSALGEIYWKYYQANRYRLLKQSVTEEFLPDDISTWDAKKIIHEVISNYSLSLREPDQTQKADLKLYDVILETNKGSKTFRPTLYDFLAHRAVEQFMNDEAAIIQPAYKFQLDKPEYFSAAADFVHIQPVTADTFSFTYHALSILRDLVSFHLADKEAYALVDVDLERLEFVYRNTVVVDKDSLYLSSLLALEKKYHDHPVDAEILYALARDYQEKGQSYDPFDESNKKYKNHIRTADGYCGDAITRFPGTDGATNCKMLRQQMCLPSLNLNTDYINSPGVPFLGLLTYRNIGKVYFRMIPLRPEQDREYLENNEEPEEIIAVYKALPPLHTWEVSLPGGDDLQSHKTQVSFPEAPLGYYVILAGTSPDFVSDKDLAVYCSLWISGISYISRRNPDNSFGFYVLDRVTGLPLKGAEVKTYTKEYNYTSRKYHFDLWRTFTTDEQGYFESEAIPPGGKPESYFAEFIYQGDRLITSNYFFQSRTAEKEDRPQITTFLFTDRAIYRPGQPIYYKGIVTEKKGGRWEIKTGFKTKVAFHDVNNSKLAEAEVVTNEYGSFNGSFTAPTGVLTGSMELRNQYGSVSVRVEEYKRPTFEVVFEPLKEGYKLGETVRLTGIVKAYAGNPLGQARVDYRVVRMVRYPYRRAFLDYYFEPAPEMEIVNGTAGTDREGRFTLEFTALPDLTVPKDLSPTFSFSISVEATDVSGETQAAQTEVSIGYKALLADLDVAESVTRNELKEMKIRTTNLSGVFEPARGTIVISRLKEPDRTFRERKWARPDMFVMTKEEFYKDFPNDLYDNEADADMLSVDAEVFRGSFDSGQDSLLRPGGTETWKAGRYRVEIHTSDRFGEAVMVKRYITLFIPADGPVPLNAPGWFRPVKDKAEPGEQVSFVVGTREKNVRVLYEVYNKDTVVSKQWLELSNGQKVIGIPVKESYRGNFGVSLVWVRSNRAYRYATDFVVPFTNKEAKVETEVFRDRLIPGQQEEWKLKIRGSKGEKLAAEFLATLYDASLDVFTPLEWNISLYNPSPPGLYWDTRNAFEPAFSRVRMPAVTDLVSPVIREYDRLNWFGFNYYGGAGFREYMRMDMSSKDLEMEGVIPPGQGDMKTALDEKAGEAITATQKPVAVSGLDKELSAVKMRKDFRETAFFFPALKTDEEGNVVFSFTVPESLTRWKFMGLAHTRDLVIGRIQKEAVTRKDLMVVPNAPRFLREGDRIAFTAKVVNLSDHDIAGNARLQLTDALTLKSLDEATGNSNPVQAFALKKGESRALSWTITVAGHTGAMTYALQATSGDFTDGEQNTLPVLTNRILVTESLPLPLNSKQTRTFTFNKLLGSSSLPTVKNHRLTLEFSSNPAWYAVQALPYLMESQYDCADNLFNRYYANAIATHIVRSKPNIREVFDQWQKFTPEALLSNLEKNQELKSALLRETPWVLDATDETSRKQRIALLFDQNRMSEELTVCLRKLQNLQKPSGCWPWFDGMPENRYITQTIVTGFGRLLNLGVIRAGEDQGTWRMLTRAIAWLDDRIRDDYFDLQKHHKDKMHEYLISSFQVQYLYARSFFRDKPVIARQNQEAYDYFLGQAKTYWTKFNKYQQGMIALALYRHGDKDLPAAILKSLREYALFSDEMGMYWRGSDQPFYWYDAPVETQALLIEAFDEAGGDSKSVELMKQWLLKQKQTQDWKTSRATADAVYALLLRGGDWLSYTGLADISIGNEKIDPFARDDTRVEAGTGYFKTAWYDGDIKPEMGKITVANPNPSIAWGAVYWQYFQDMDKITPHETPLKLQKKLFIEQPTDAGPVIVPLGENHPLRVGDKVIVRMELRTDRDLEYVHLKDLRSSAFEPLNTLSGYQYRGGLGYYQSTLDVSSNFFFDYLKKGTYVFEYPVFVTQEGDFSSGMANIQCLYAPEFASHSEGSRITVTR
jgi:hypothetical protein